MAPNAPVSAPSSAPTDLSLPVYNDILDARNRIAGQAVVTPLISIPLLDEITGGQVFLKAENLQKTGSFKFRGAYNRLVQIPEQDRINGVVACSSGNHAQGVAEAARLLGMGATIVMPEDAPVTKRKRTERSGAKVVTYDRTTEDRDAIALEICAQSGATFVHPFNDPAIIAGQGTCGLEICETLLEKGLSADFFLACCGGGGLTAGTTLAMKRHFPDCVCYAVEPRDFDDYTRSLNSGHRETNDKAARSICDALLTESPGERSFAINRTTLNGGLTISDEEALRAVAFAFREAKLVVEPGGAVTLAALLAKKIDVSGKVVAATISGGNIDGDMMARALDAHP